MGLISRVSSRTYRFSLRQPSTPKMENDNGRTFHKQAATNLVRNKLNKSKKSARYTRSIGLGIKTPRDAKAMEYVDKKCPFTGNVSPCFRDIKSGDVVTVGECRPLAKTVKFNVIKVASAGGKKGFDKF